MTAFLHDLCRAYREAAGGDPQKALEMALAELLDARAEADFRAQALDQWVSRGYVQGTASELCRRQAERFTAGRASEGQREKRNAPASE